jgi:NAD(P)-dependent dehydrogenase (short-subunit alcohol dehydrogenase family)
MTSGLFEKDHALRLARRVAVVTGSSSGHGRAIAVELAAEGAKVLCSDVRKSTHPDALGDDEAEIDTDDLINKRGGEADYLAADVTSEQDMEALADRAAERFGRLDVWVNNAGAASAAYITEATLADLQKDLNVNVVGTWLGVRAAVRVMRQQERVGRSLGHVINIGSVAGEIGQAELSGYSASKGAVHAMTRALAIELAPDFINVNAIAPGYFVQTALNKVIRDLDLTKMVEELHPWPEMASTRDVGRAVAFLASEDSTWVTGSILAVDGGILAK